MCNPGIKESGDARSYAAWQGALATFRAYRARGAPIGFAADPRTGHECGDSRYLAIPFFDACLALRLPDRGKSDQALRPVDRAGAWLAPLPGDTAVPASASPGAENEAVWLPDERLAHAWMEYVKQGATSDATPPPPPTRVTLAGKSDHAVEITWDAEADLESGIAGFLIERDGRRLAQVPENPVGKYGRPLFQTLSYHDTPEKPLPEMRFIDREAGAGVEHEYRVSTINGVGLRSAPVGPNPR
jgi:hypothetical protein